MQNAVVPFTEAGRLVGMRLSQFRTGSADLLPAHRQWIDRNFLPKIRQHPYAWVDLIGSASRTGSAQDNLKLSARRIAAVEAYLKAGYPKLEFNVRLSQGESIAASHNTPESNDDGYWRAVLIRWYGVPLQIPGPEPEPSGVKLRTYEAPQGCWCIIGVDSFGAGIGKPSGKEDFPSAKLPFGVGPAAGRVTLTLLNDQGEKWILTGLGVGVNAGLELSPKFASKALELMVSTLVGIGLKAGDLQNVSQTIKDLRLVGPSETNGGVFRRLTWAANLTLTEITNSGFFTIRSGELHLGIAGADLGWILFGPPYPVVESMQLLYRPWGYFTSVGLVTWKAAFGVGGMTYKIISTERQLQPTTI